MAPHKRIGQSWAVFVTILMLGVTFFYWHNEERELTQKREDGFSQAADQIALNIDRRLATFELALRGVKGFVENSDVVSRAEYRGYFQALQLPETQPGMQGLAVASLVLKASRNRHADQMLKRGYANYRIHPEGERAQYAPITLIEPYSGQNVTAIGFDIASNAQVEPALRLARDTGSMALSNATNLVQDGGKDLKAVVMYLPIYSRGKPVITLRDRRAAISGWVSGPFRVSDLIIGLGKQLDADIGISLYEGDDLSPAHWLYGERSPVRPDAKDNHLYTTRTLNVGGQRWTLIMRSLPDFDAKYVGEDSHKIIAAFGGTFSLLMGWVAWLLATGRDRALTMAHAMTQSLRAVQADQDATLDAMPDVLFELDLDGRYYKYRTSRMNLLAAPPEFFLGKLISEVLPHTAAKICSEALHEANLNGFSVGRQIDIPLGNESHWFELSIAKKAEVPNESQRFIMISRDITERKRAEEALRIAATAFDSQQGMAITNAQRVILQVNRAFTVITGYSSEEVVGKTPSILASGRYDSAFYATMTQALETTGEWAGEIWNRRKSGEVYPEWLSISAVKDNEENITHFVAIFSDVSDHVQALAQIDALAFYDPLTQLPNRRLLLNRLDQSLHASTRHARKNALLFIDLDNFKTINDTLGHSQGDLLLVQVAQRLKGCVRDGDTVAHLGSDEFVVMLEDLSEDEIEAATHAETVGRNILKTFEEDFQLAQSLHHSTPSVGITLFGGSALEGSEQPLRRAELAMFQVKAAGRNTLRFFDTQMQADVSAHAAMEADLREAVVKQQFLLYYQPQVVGGGHVAGVEALIRWTPPHRGMVSPAHFIPLAEETGLILQLGQWVLDTACVQLAKWAKLPELSHLTIAVNVSARQFQQPDFVESVLATLERTNANPKRLKLELTESMLVDNVEAIIVKMGALKAHSIAFSLDDFGTGYSSLAYLKRLPLDQLKIDQGFVRNIVTDPNDAAIAKMIVALAESMGLSVIAEGVELQAQADFLAHLGCHAFQGYLFGRPQSAHSIEELVVKRK
ncbi:EAL domain-containing protein [Rhodoferax sp. GW822-FHT02A01]|uniref:bifunctional diguanylate cyclase/phosphodiesterase n=1 Tax=Rhodoferax sp. GW822-FHT02A01 TaxID=3141537 RepID=UPI00315C9858